MRHNPPINRTAQRLRRCVPSALRALAAVVLDKTNNRVLHKERFTFSPIRDGGATVKLIYQIGEFLGGLQFTLMLYSNGTYEAFISPVPDGKVVSSGAVSSKNTNVQIDWSGTVYGFSVTAL